MAKVKTNKTHDNIQDAQTLQEAGDFRIIEANGERKFHSRRFWRTQQLIIFIRHFFSSVSYVLYWLLGATFALTVDGQDCEDYIRTLSKELPPALLNASTPPTKLFIIGCGEMDAVPETTVRAPCTPSSALIRISPSTVTLPGNCTKNSACWKI